MASRDFGLSQNSVFDAQYISTEINEAIPQHSFVIATHWEADAFSSVSSRTKRAFLRNASRAPGK
jgi:hypothetical protein